MVPWLFSSLLFSGCNDYLDLIPKGKKVPTTLEDYRAFLQDPNVYTTGDFHKTYIVNEFKIDDYMKSDPVSATNYFWLEDGDRISNLEYDGNYTNNYDAIYAANLVVEGVPTVSVNGEAEVKKAKAIIAQGKVLRVLHYFHLINSYAKAYDPATAATDGGIPYSTSSNNFETPIPQRTVGEVYGYMLNDLNSAIPDLPEEADNFMEANKAAGYALRARVYLFMKNFEEALKDADEALKRNDYIFDMVAYHREYVDPNGTGVNIQGDGAAIGGLPRITYSLGVRENLLVTGGINGVNSVTRPGNLPIKDSLENQHCTRDSSRYEVGDTRFLCTYYRSTAAGYYQYRRGDNMNIGGLRTTEVYLIRAECYARQGELQKAMNDLNALRVKRIVARVYQPLTATTRLEAINHIRHERDAELLGSDMMFYDMRRFNTETEYQRTMVKKDEDGIIRTLRPESELWVLPFPMNVTRFNPNLKQNTSI